MRLHHLNLVTRDGSAARRKLSSLYGFIDYGVIQHDACSNTYVLKQNDIYLTVTEQNQNYIDTINDIAFCVDSVEQCCEDVNTYGGEVLETPHIVNCTNKIISFDEIHTNDCNCPTLQCENFVVKAIIKSPVGNIRHSIYNKRNFAGDFLPGFVRFCNEDIESEPRGPDHIDHIALAVPCNAATLHIKWYQHCMKLLRFKTSVKESTSGLVIRAKHGNGVRLVTLVEHPCSDMAIFSNNENKEVEMRNGQVKFVFCESLLDEGSDQIQTFLTQHSGAGVQHVAFHTKQILTDAQNWTDRGVDFIKPPSTYYDEIFSTLEKLKSKYDIDHIRDNGILIDAEKLNENTPSEEGYLYQVFTKPVFDSKTFFFELIQREQARGFGAGNVSALWRALDAHIQSCKYSDTLSGDNC